MQTSRRRSVYPFTAIVGQERMKRALVLNAVNPAIGGVLIRGERGTAKSTAARALAALLPEIQVVADCRFSCDPRRPEQRGPNPRRSSPPGGGPGRPPALDPGLGRSPGPIPSPVIPFSRSQGLGVRVDSSPLDPIRARSRVCSPPER